MGCIKPPCAVLEDDAKYDVSDDTCCNNEYALPVLFEESESYVEKKIHKDNARDVPYIRMPCFVTVNCKRRIDVKRYLSPCSECYIHKECKCCRNQYGNDSYRNESLEKVGLRLGTFI